MRAGRSNVKTGLFNQIEGRETHEGENGTTKEGTESGSDKSNSGVFSKISGAFI